MIDREFSLSRFDGYFTMTAPGIDAALGEPEHYSDVLVKVPEGQHLNFLTAIAAWGTLTETEQHRLCEMLKIAAGPEGDDI